jgi:hypothetical protein
MVDGFARAAGLQQRLDEQGVGRLVERVHLEPVVGDGDAVVGVARGQGVAAQLVIGGGDLTANVLAGGAQPLVEPAGLGQVEVGSSVAESTCGRLLGARATER